MNQTSTAINVPPLGVHDREEVGNQLQATLVELVDLSLYGKQLHWCVVGREFRSLHLQLDELIDSWRDLGDTVAERAVALGHFPDGQVGAVAAARTTEPLPAGPIEDMEVVRLLTRQLAVISERVRVRMDRLGEEDAVSQDVLIDVLRALEEHLWMVRAQHVQGDA